ncbi:hypothetical protein FIBSPDRAFT_969651, partial [Athelia psychrophila]
MDRIHHGHGHGQPPRRLSLAPGDYGRRTSEAMLSEGGGPMTPPLSPGNSDTGEMGDSIMVDSEPRFSGP